MATIILIVVTCLVSILCFTGRLNANKLLFHPYSVWHRKEWYRMLTYGAVHGGCGFDLQPGDYIDSSGS